MFKLIGFISIIELKELMAYFIKIDFIYLKCAQETYGLLHQDHLHLPE